ncbi:hypothetical protein Bhyg_15004 [Pseudolycoriella hygida]|uniref:Uncharacterized protein n=1 Tax=Pseudolycoriella hygida TaxID=35572 RepID=A0A9Q0MRQ5_9DIPT|nr:hypothetical protein Bhyg_15004 [Pseudolycoriella hygida]
MKLSNMLVRQFKLYLNIYSNMYIAFTAVQLHIDISSAFSLLLLQVLPSCEHFSWVCFIVEEKITGHWIDMGT